MATFGELVTEASKKLLDTSNTAVTAADVANSINDAIKYRKKQRYWFNETVATLTLSDGVGTVTLPSDFLVENPRNALTVLYNTVKYDVMKVKPEDFDAGDATGTGMPFIYTYRGRVMEVYYIPDQDYTAYLRYQKDYDAFATDGSADNTSNDFTTYADRLILYDALSRLHGENRQDEKMFAYYSARAQVEHQNLLNETNRHNSTGSLSIDTII